MNDKISIQKQLRGFVRVQNEAGDVVEARNLVVYNGGDIIARLLAGFPEYKISHMYFGFENTAGVPSFAAPARGDTADFFHTPATPATQDFLRATVQQPPLLEAADGNHLFNRAIFSAIAVDSVGVLGLPFTAGSNSKVATIGLVAAPTGVYTGDLLYARVNLGTALPVVGSGQISATWATEAD